MPVRISNIFIIYINPGKFFFSMTRKSTCLDTWEKVTLYRDQKFLWYFKEIYI